MPGGFAGLQLYSLSKSFGDFCANDNISLNLTPGTIFTLLGENGAGKSTLLSLLSGQLQPDSGEIRLDGKRLSFRNPEQAIAAGIGMVRQHSMLVDSMSVGENFFLAGSGGLWLSRKKTAREVHRLALGFGIEVDPDRRVEELSLGERRQVEILMLLQKKAKVFIFDESTSLLSNSEVERLLTIMRELADGGAIVIFVTHKLEEALEVADRIGIMRRGRLQHLVDAKTVTKTGDLWRLIFDQDLGSELRRVPMVARQNILNIENLSGNGLVDINLQLRQGQIVAVVGAPGNGQKELVAVVSGKMPPAGGRTRILGRDWQEFFDDKKSSRLLSHLPEDSGRLASCMDLDLVDNILLSTGELFVRRGILQRDRAKVVAEKLLADFNIQATGLETKAGRLSGGNMQKLVLAGIFYRKPKIMVVEQPTQGLDARATGEIWELLLKCREQVGVLLVTASLSEALVLSDRIAVMVQGKIVETVDSDDANRSERLQRVLAGTEGCTGK